MTYLEERYRKLTNDQLVSFFQHLWKCRHTVYRLRNGGEKTEAGRKYCQNNHRVCLRAYIREMRRRKTRTGARERP